MQDTEGTWLAGKEGPAAMIMPADPHVGDVNRPESIPGLVWEEALAAVDRTRIDTRLVRSARASETRASPPPPAAPRSWGGCSRATDP